MPSHHQKLRIIVGGLVGQYPLGGVAWDYFHYVLALDDLGHDVYYYEDTWVWPFDPVLKYLSDKPDHTVRFISSFFQTYAPQLSGKWQYLLLHEKAFGMSRESFEEIAKTADVFLNVSGACFFPEKLNPACIKVFLDTDPGYNQFVLSEKYAWSENVERWCKAVADHDRHFTYAENIYGADCVIPRMNFDWQPTRCVVKLDSWAKVRSSPVPTGAPFTTVMTLGYFPGDVRYQGKSYGAKVPEFEKFIGLPAKTSLPLALAMSAEKVELEPVRQHGWRILDSVNITLTTEGYMQFIADSGGEWSVAKNIYVDTNSGWFSCRTACYLAGGRPAVVQDTAWSRFIPSGKGIFAFGTMEEAAAGLEEIAAHPLEHRAAAYEIAREYLAGDRVLPAMIEAIFRKKTP